MSRYFMLIKTLCLGVLFFNPLIAAAECPSGGSAKVISKVHTTTREYRGSNTDKIDENYITQCASWDSKAKEGTILASSHIFWLGRHGINKKPECKPYGQLARKCVDHKVLEVFPVAESASPHHDGPACGVNWQYTVCAYSPFKKGIMGKKTPSEQRGQRRVRERDR